MEVQFVDISQVLDGKDFLQTSILIDCSKDLSALDFTKLTHVENLKLQNYSSAYAFNLDCTNLKYLDLSISHLEHYDDKRTMLDGIPKEVFCCQNLEDINLNYTLSEVETDDAKVQKVINKIVNDLSKIKSLKKLRMEQSDILDFVDLSRLKKLEFLNVGASYNLESLRGLDKFKSLKTFNLTAAGYIEDEEETRTILQNCSNIQNMTLPDELQLIYDEIKTAPFLKKIVKEIETSKDIGAFQKGIDELYEVVSKKTDPTRPTPLYSIYNLSSEPYIQYGIPIKALDKKLNEFKEDLRPADLLNLISCSCRNKMDNIHLTLICANEVVRRQDPELDIAFVKLYLEIIKVDSDFDPNNYLVTDFIRLEYLDLLTIDAIEYLFKKYLRVSPEYCHGSSGIEHIFKKSLIRFQGHKPTIERIIKLLQTFYDRNVEDLHDSYFEELYEDVKSNCSQEISKKVKKTLKL